MESGRVAAVELNQFIEKDQTLSLVIFSIFHPSWSITLAEGFTFSLFTLGQHFRLCWWAGADSVSRQKIMNE